VATARAERRAPPPTASTAGHWRALSAWRVPPASSPSLRSAARHPPHHVRDAHTRRIQRRATERSLLCCAVCRVPCAVCCVPCVRVRVTVLRAEQPCDPPHRPLPLRHPLPHAAPHIHSLSQPITAYGSCTASAGLDYPPSLCLSLSVCVCVRGPFSLLGFPYPNPVHVVYAMPGGDGRALELLAYSRVLISVISTCPVARRGIGGSTGL
jgi:hypothetical protein